MIRVPLLVLLIAGASAACAQQPPAGCDGPEYHALDFWVGDWDLSYSQGGKTGTSRNHVTKILDGCVVQEEFEGPPGTPMRGRSVSMYDRASGRWKQAWVDSQGSYLDFTGGVEDGRMVFAREVERNGQHIRQRMVFDEVTPRSLTWRWQRSTDAGATWSTLWEIAYRRSGS